MSIKLQNDELEEYLKLFFKDDFDTFLNTTPEPTGIRINTLKISADKFKKKLNDWKQTYNNIPFHTNGIIFKNDHLPLSHTLDYFCGNIFYQGISSQLPVELLNVKPGDTVLDIAAAPGSKSCQMVAKLKGKGILITNDSSYKRMQPLNVNLQRTGATNFYVLNDWGERLGQLYPEYFDQVLLDAPCTALGTLAASADITRWWRLEKLQKLAKSQFSLLVSGVKSLKVGGELVYSTCSIAPEENEMVIQKILDKYPVEIVEPPHRLKSLFNSGIAFYQTKELNESLTQAVRIYPHIHGFEGFFAIKLRKYDSINKSKNEKNISFKVLQEWDHPQIIPVLENLSNNWGISHSIWKHYKFNLMKNRIWMVSNIDKIPTDKFVCSGILLAEKKLKGWKLFNNGVSFLGHSIKNRRCVLEDENLKRLFRNGLIPCNELENGYYALTRNEQPFASVYVEKGEMRIKLPHKFNLVLDITRNKV